jgi:hypothetical protein
MVSAHCLLRALLDVDGVPITKDKAAEILADVCFKYSVKPGRAPGASDILDDGPSWTLKANVTGKCHVPQRTTTLTGSIF